MTDEPNVPAGMRVHQVSADTVLDLSRAMALAAGIAAPEHANRADLMMACLFLYYLLLTNTPIEDSAEDVLKTMMTFKGFAETMSQQAALFVMQTDGVA